MQQPEDRENMVTARMSRRQCGWSPEGEAREQWMPDQPQPEGSEPWRGALVRRSKGEMGNPSWVPRERAALLWYQSRPAEVSAAQ